VWRPQSFVYPAKRGIILHVPSHIVHITVHDLHNAMKWETADSIVAQWTSWDCTYLKTVQRSHSHTTLHCIYYTLHFTVNLLKSTSTDSNRTVMWWYALPNIYSWKPGWKWKIPLCITPQMNFQNENHLPFVNTMTHFLHISQKIITHYFKNLTNDILCFTIHIIFLWPYILHANNKRSLVG
jgi:hypothetical protein